MKAKELMLGDWVYGLYPGGSRYKPPFRISAVDTYPSNKSPRIVTEGGYGFQEEHLAPIPITGEILEKNGFKRVRDKLGRVFYSIADDYFDLTIDEITDSIWCMEYDNLEAQFPTCRNLVAHVHELQHALKLYGIDREITL